MVKLLGIGGPIYRAGRRLWGMDTSEAAPAFSPASLFGPPDGGYWWQASKADLWQDVARTTPVTAPGDPIRSVRAYTATGVVYFERPDATGIPVYRENANGRGYIEGAGTGPGSTNGLRLTTVGFSAPSELYWYGSAIASSGAGVAGFGWESTQRFASRYGTLGASTWITGFPVTSGLNRYSFSATGNLSALAVYGVRCTAAPFAEAVVNNVAVASGTPPEALVASDSGTFHIAREYPCNIYGGVRIDKTLTSQQRADLQDWFVALSNP